MPHKIRIWPASLLAVAACGRVDAVNVDGGASAGPAPIAYVAPFVHQYVSTAGEIHSFTAQATTAGDAIVLQVGCAASAEPNAVTVAAQGWQFTRLGPITGSSTSVERGATFAAIAPDAIGVTVTVSWSGTNCTATNAVGDEFTGIDPAGGGTTFDAVAANEGTNNCTGSIRTGHVGDAVWVACAGMVSALGPGLAKGADDGAGDWSAYRLTDDPAGTLENIELTSSNEGHVLSMVTIKPAG